MSKRAVRVARFGWRVSLFLVVALLGAVMYASTGCGGGRDPLEIGPGKPDAAGGDQVTLPGDQAKRPDTPAADQKAPDRPQPGDLSGPDKPVVPPVDAGPDAMPPKDTGGPDAAPQADEPVVEAPAQDIVIPEGPFTCTDIPRVPTVVQVRIVEGDLTCVPVFVTGMLRQPQVHLQAFLRLLRSHKTTEKLFLEVYKHLRAKTFVFGASTVDALYRDLPGAVKLCVGHSRCKEWDAHILAALLRGDLYKCPDLSKLSVAQLLQSAPYGNHYCTDLTAAALAPKLDGQTVTGLLSIAKTHKMPWGRRNGLRLLGRFLERPKGDAAQVLVFKTRGTDVRAGALDRLQNDKALVVLQDAIWLLDSFFFPYPQTKPFLAAIALAKQHHESLRFRAIRAYFRLLEVQKTALTAADVQFIVDGLVSDNQWVRAQAAFMFEAARKHHITPSIRTRLLNAVKDAWKKEKDWVALVYMAKAIDKYEGTQHALTLKRTFESKHLGNVAYSTKRDLTVRSGLPQSQLPAIVTLLEQLRAAFFKLMGRDFQTPVAGDVNTKMTLIVFATKARYQEYMNAFVGYGGSSGGLYIEKGATLYTYERLPSQSIYTLTELIKHEFMHYMQGRYVYPMSWTDPGYHKEPRGWADEGYGELFAGIKLGTNGSYSFPIRMSSLRSICGTTYRPAKDLLAQTFGYSVEGTFDYPSAWAWTYFLFTKHRTAALKIFKSFRNGTYKLSSFDAISGKSLQALSAEWHREVRSWCKANKLPVSAPPAGTAPTRAPPPHVHVHRIHKLLPRAFPLRLPAHSH